jgi:hypothetical protein
MLFNKISIIYCATTFDFYHKLLVYIFESQPWTFYIILKVSDLVFILKPSLAYWLVDHLHRIYNVIVSKLSYILIE